MKGVKETTIPDFSLKEGLYTFSLVYIILYIALHWQLFIDTFRSIYLYIHPLLIRSRSSFSQLLNSFIIFKMTFMMIFRITFKTGNIKVSKNTLKRISKETSRGFQGGLQVYKIHTNTNFQLKSRVKTNLYSL